MYQNLSLVFQTLFEIQLLRPVFTVISALLISEIPSWIFTAKQSSQLPSQLPPQSFIEPTPSRKKEALICRVRDIPQNVSLDSFKAQLESALGIEDNQESQPSWDDSLHLTLARSSSRSLMATFTSYKSAKDMEYLVEEDFTGVTPLHDPGDQEALIDIIAVPGLDSHAIGGFKAVDSNNVWIRDFLPLDVPNARILVYGYDTSLTGDASKHSISDLGSTFLDSITAFRSSTKTSCRPMILIGHDLGGLILKKALSLAYENREQLRSRNFFKSAHSLVFFGVPNLGSNMMNSADITAGKSVGQLIRDLSIDNELEPSPYLRNLSDEFMRCSRKQNPGFQIAAYFEAKTSPSIQIDPSNGTLSRNGPAVMMVSQESARRIGFLDHTPQQLPTDHFELVKFSSDSDMSYLRVVERIKALAKDCSGVIKQRFSDTKGI